MSAERVFLFAVVLFVGFAAGNIVFHGGRTMPALGLWSTSQETSILTASASCDDTLIGVRVTYAEGMADGGVTAGVAKVFPMNPGITPASLDLDVGAGVAQGSGDVGFGCALSDFWVCLYPAGVCTDGMITGVEK